jgi:hypothetical protein
MKILTNLTAVATESPAVPHRGIRVGSHQELAPGFFTFVGISDGMLALHANDEQIAIPMTEIWKLCQSVNPKFTPTPQKKK